MLVTLIHGILTNVNVTARRFSGDCYMVRAVSKIWEFPKSRDPCV